MSIYSILIIIIDNRSPSKGVQRFHIVDLLVVGWVELVVDIGVQYEIDLILVCELVMEQNLFAWLD